MLPAIAADADVSSLDAASSAVVAAEVAVAVAVLAGYGQRVGGG
jgi:hypothetical protein